MAHVKEPQTPGGMRLRALREACGKTQLDVELDAHLGIGYLQRLELGKIQQPERDTLERILAALAVGFVERCELFALFGYTAAVSMPNASETAWAIDIFHAEVKQAIMPVYLLDCSHRLLAWNALVPQLFGQFATAANNLLMPHFIFDPIDGIAGSILNADTFFPAQIRILQYEKQRYSDESWYNSFVSDMRHYKAFDHYWIKQNTESRAHIPMRPLTPLNLDTGRGLTQFRLIAETFAQDHRFRIIYYLPADPLTMRQCMEWQS